MICRKRTQEDLSQVFFLRCVFFQLSSLSHRSTRSAKKAPFLYNHWKQSGHLSCFLFDTTMHRRILASRLYYRAKQKRDRKEPLVFPVMKQVSLFYCFNSADHSDPAAVHFPSAGVPDSEDRWWMNKMPDLPGTAGQTGCLPEVLPEIAVHTAAGRTEPAVLPVKTAAVHLVLPLPEKDPSGRYPYSSFSLRSERSRE